MKTCYKICQINEPFPVLSSPEAKRRLAVCPGPSVQSRPGRQLERRQDVAAPLLLSGPLPPFHNRYCGWERKNTVMMLCCVYKSRIRAARVCICVFVDANAEDRGGDLASHERACEVTLPVWEPWHTLYCRLCHFWWIFLLAFIFPPNHSPKPCCLHFVPLPFTLKWCPLVVISVFVALWKNCGFKLNTRSAATFFCYNTPCLYCVDLDQVLITVWRH